jgi:phosphonate transport system ATP-binding protein
VTGPTVVALRGAGVRYGPRAALAGVDLQVRAGERVAMIGPSGAGKSTLLGLLNGTVTATDGDVEVLGTALRGIAPRRLRAVQARIGTVHQRLDLVGELRVVHNVNAGRLGTWGALPALASLVHPAGTRAVRDALERVGLADRLHDRTGDLSGGEQQRVAIARVLLQRPALLLADEPVASLDPARAGEVVDLLRSAVTGALVASLHDVSLALGRFGRVVGLRAGRVVFDGPPAELPPETLTALYDLEEPRGSPSVAPVVVRPSLRTGC